MKLRVARSAFLRALERTAAADAQLEAGPFAGAVLLNADASVFTLTLRDHVYTASTQIACTTNAGGSVALSHRNLTDFVRRMVGEVVAIEVRGAVLHVASGTDKVELPCESSPTYPLPPQAPEGSALHIPTSALRFVLEHVAHAMHDDPTHPQLACATLLVSATEVEARATDGHRYAVASAAAEISGSPQRWTLSSRLVRKLSATHTEDSREVLVTQTQSHLFFKWPDLHLAALRRDDCLVHDQLPEPNGIAATSVVQRVDLARAMALIAGISPGPTRQAPAVQLRLLERTMRISGTNGNDTGAATSVNAIVKGVHASVTLQGLPLRDAVQNAEADTVSIDFGSEYALVIVRGETDNRRTFSFLPTHALR